MSSDSSKKSLVKNLIKFGYDVRICQAIADKVFASVRGIIGSNCPEDHCYDWEKMRVDSPLPLDPLPDPIPVKKRFKTVKGMCNNIRTKAQMKVERSFKPKPRNVHDGTAVINKLLSIKFDVPDPDVILSTSFIKETLRLAGLGRTTGADMRAKAFADIKLPRPQAGLGATVDPFRGKVYQGLKGEWANMGPTNAYQLFKLISSFRLEWEDCSNLKFVKDLITAIGMFFVPALRVDGNPDNPRIIWIGSYILYCIETLLTKGIKCDMANSMNFGYHPDRVHEWMASHKGKTFLSGDISRWDLCQNWKMQVAVWRAWQELYDLPKSAAILCAIYNIYTPIVLPSNEGAYLQTRRGIQPSGSGAFVITNNLLNLCYQRFISIVLSPLGNEECIPLVFGDDFVVAVTYGAELWASLASVLFNIVMKEKEQVISKSFILFLRRFFVPGGWNNGGYYHEPVVLSRLRNALFPKASNPNDRHPAVVALAMRAQSLEILYGAIHSRKKGYNEIWQFWSEHVCPSECMMLNYTDNELAAMMPEYGWEERDSLTYVKRALSLNDSLQLLK